MTAWDKYFEEETRRIEAAIKARLVARSPFEHPVKLAPAPTHTETIKAMWQAVRDQWPTRQIEGRLVAIHDIGVLPDVLFEQIQYGDIWVIEAEGVVVERLPAR